MNNPTMTSKTLHPSLSLSGWTNNPEEVIDAMFTHFFVAEHSQSASFPEGVTSYPHLLQRYRNDPSALASATRDALFTYFSTQFSEVDVVVTPMDDVENPSKAAISIYVTLVDQNGKQHNLAKLGAGNTSYLDAFMAINNQ